MTSPFDPAASDVLRGAGRPLLAGGVGRASDGPPRCDTCGHVVALVTDRIGRLVPDCAACRRNAFRARYGLPPIVLGAPRAVEPEPVFDGQVTRRVLTRIPYAERRRLIAQALVAGPLTVKEIAASIWRSEAATRDDVYRMVAEGAVVQAERTPATAYVYSLERVRIAGLATSIRERTLRVLEAAKPRALASAQIAARAGCHSHHVGTALRPLINAGTVRRVRIHATGRGGTAGVRYAYRLAA